MKKILCNTVKLKQEDILDRLEKRISKWQKMKRVLAYCLRFLHKLAAKTKKGINRTQDSQIALSEIQIAESKPIQMVQERSFKICQMKSDSFDNKITVTHPTLKKLNPFLDGSGTLRVGGRLRNADLDYKVKYPVIVPRDCSIAEMIVRWCHQNVEHGGRGYTQNEVRSQGIWISKCSSLVKKVIANCVLCRKLRGSFCQQKMGDLPFERSEEMPPFTYCGIDYFGPVLVKEGRKELKRYGVLFTCFASRAIHIETANSLETDSFILALRRFLSRRGSVRTIWTDNGTNFVGAEAELGNCLKELDQKKILDFLLSNQCEVQSWKRNPPSASHMGGIWERQIRSVRSVLSGILRCNPFTLDDESLRTYLAEVENIVNSRPLTTDTMNDPHSLTPLTPHQLLTMKSKIVLPPPGVFQKTDLYCRRRWRRVQHLAEQFWDQVEKGVSTEGTRIQQVDVE